MPSVSSSSVAEILRLHVSLELEGLDRIYQNVYVPKLQYPSGIATFLRYHRGAQYASSVLLQPISDAFLAKTEGVLFVGQAQEKTPVIRTEKRQNPRTGRPYP